jgi:hypothetical protein
MYLKIATPCKNSASQSLYHKDSADVDSPTALPTQTLKLRVAQSPSKPALKPRRLHLKKLTVNRNSLVNESHAGHFGSFADMQRKNDESAFSSSSFSVVSDPCKHTLNDFPNFVRCSGRDLRSETAKKQFPSECSRMEMFNLPICRNTVTPKTGVYDANSKTGLGCLPKAERVSAAPNSKANSFLYKNEYKSLSASSDVKQMAKLQKSRDSVTHANSPSRLRELMNASKPQYAMPALMNER